jgi:hypothetical protein
MRVQKISAGEPLKIQRVKVMKDESQLDLKILKQADAISCRGLRYQGYGKLNHPSKLIEDFVTVRSPPKQLPQYSGHVSQRVKKLVADSLQPPTYAQPLPKNMH